MGKPHRFVKAAIVCFPGIFCRGGAEQKIRKYLVDNNYVETVISLAPNLFYPKLPKLIKNALECSHLRCHGAGFV